MVTMIHDILLVPHDSLKNSQAFSLHRQGPNVGLLMGKLYVKDNPPP